MVVLTDGSTARACRLNQDDRGQRELLWGFGSFSDVMEHCVIPHMRKAQRLVVATEDVDGKPHMLLSKEGFRLASAVREEAAAQLEEETQELVQQYDGILSEEEKAIALKQRDMYFIGEMLYRMYPDCFQPVRPLSPDVYNMYM